MQGNTFFLTDDQKVIWAEAGTTFPGEQLDKIIQRALVDLPIDKAPADFYEVRRFDAPHVFEALLKLQNTGLARSHIEVDEDEFREVLRVEATLFDLIMQAIKMLLDVFLRVLGGALKSSTSASPEPLREPPVVPPIPAPIRQKQKQQPRIEHDGYSL